MIEEVNGFELTELYFYDIYYGDGIIYNYMPHIIDNDQSNDENYKDHIIDHDIQESYHYNDENYQSSLNNEKSSLTCQCLNVELWKSLDSNDGTGDHEAFL